VPNGVRQVTATVRDAAGKTGSTSTNVTVRNATSTPAPSPTPAPPASTGALTVAVTQPAGGATVKGTAWVVLWVEGSSGSSNAFTLAVDGKTIGTQTTAARGPVSIAWNTASTANGAHTLTATVRDATGKTGRSSLTVTVKN